MPRSTISGTAIDLDGKEMILDADQDTTITADTDDTIDFKIAGVEHISLSNSSGDTVIKPRVDTKEIIFQQFDGNEVARITDGRKLKFFDDGGESITSDGSNLKLESGGTTFTMPDSDGSNGQFLKTDGSGTLSFATVSTGVALDDISTGDAASTLATSSGDITLDSTADIVLDADGGDVHFQDNGSSNRFISIKNSSGSCIMSNPTADGDITFQGNDDGVGAVNALVLDMSAGGAATFNKGVTLSDGDITLASGHGISFAATSDASGMANELLDDYEEGTWTPTGNGVTFSGNSGTYTKIGRVVYVNFVFTIPSNSNGNNCTVSGFPFTSSSSNATRGGFVTGFTSIDADARKLVLFMGTSSTTAAFNNQDGNAVTNNDFSGGGQLFKSGFYMV